jgi:hypothetical protein
MRFHRNTRQYVRQYKGLPRVLGGDYDPDLGLQVVAFLCNRHALRDEASVQRELAKVDVETARALASTSDEWRLRFNRWATQCGFAAAPWWLMVRNLSRQLMGEVTDIPALFSPATDVWLSVESGSPTPVEMPVADLAKLMTGVSEGMSAVLRAVMGIGPHKAGGRYGPDYERRRDWRPAVVLPSSLHVGLVLPREDIDTPGSPPYPESVEAAARFIEAVCLVGSEDENALRSLLPDEACRATVVESVSTLRSALPSERETLQLSASETITGTSAVVRRLRPRARAKREVRHVTVSGVIRGIDLDDHTFRLRTEAGAHIVVRYEEGDLFVDTQSVPSWLDRVVEVKGRTRDKSSPPRLVLLDGVVPPG